VDKNILLFVITSDGTGLKQLTESKGEYIPFVTNPSISDDGKKVAFQDSVAVGSNIFVVNSDGTGLIQLTTTSGDYSKNISPSISGDASKIAFTYTASILDEHSSEIFLVNVDGSGLTQLTSNNKGARYPTLNGDGSKVVFLQGFDNYTEIFIVNADGSGLTRLTSNNDKEQYPSISGSGNKVAFESNGNVVVITDGSRGNQTPSLDYTGSLNGELAFPTEIIVVCLVVAVVAAVLVIIYLKRKG
jgi:TolB protein